jgi:hypothetical protein
MESAFSLTRSAPLLCSTADASRARRQHTSNKTAIMAEKALLTKIVFALFNMLFDDGNDGEDE